MSHFAELDQYNDTADHNTWLETTIEGLHELANMHGYHLCTYWNGVRSYVISDKNDKGSRPFTTTEKDVAIKYIRGK